MNEFIIVESFESKEDFGTDPYGYYILLNGVKLKAFGDDYHDNGSAKSIAFIDGFILGKDIKDYTVTTEERDDYKF